MKLSREELLEVEPTLPLQIPTVSIPERDPEKLYNTPLPSPVSASEIRKKTALHPPKDPGRCKARRHDE